MADWEEVKRLAADFQRAQLSVAKQRLSERNVIELVSKLVNLKLIDVIYTLDGKEYLTHQELYKEITDELLVNGGRINLVDLQQLLNVDFSHIESKASEIIKHEKNRSLVLGQLIDISYLDKIAEEVNDKLQDQGHVTIPELTKLYDLPADFLSEHIHHRVGKIIHGHVDAYDRDVIFTESFITRMKAQIRGTFSAITRPTVIQSIMSRHSFQERLFYSLLEDLVNKGRLAGSISGGRQEKALYIPNIYTKSQNEWVDSFYKQNGYLEYDSLIRLGIADPKSYIKRRFKDEAMTYLGTCCIGAAIKDQVEASVEEADTNDTWIDIMPVLPSIFSMEDVKQILTECSKKYPHTAVCCDTIVTSDKFIQKWNEPFKDLVIKKAEMDVRNNPSLFSNEASKGSGKFSKIDEGGKEDRKDQRRKKAAGVSKSGGGTQGREVKTRSTKKKFKAQERDDSDDDVATNSMKEKQQACQFMSLEELENHLKEQTELEDCPDSFIAEIALQLHRPLTRQYQEAAKSVFLTQSGTGTARKKTHGELQEKISGLWTSCCLFEKGMKQFNEETSAQLVKHLLKTVCSDITNIVVSAVATEHMMSVQEDMQLTPEGRATIIVKLPDNMQQILSKLHTSLNGKSLEEFNNQLNIICSPEHLGVMLKKPDKKKERQLVFNQRQVLLEQLKSETDPAVALHLSSVILIHTYTQNIVHIPGKCVPLLIEFLKSHMEADKYDLLHNQQDLIMKMMKVQGNEEKKDEFSALESEANLQMDEIKKVVVMGKKSTVAET
ncbi:E3 UFM1-protein ligase 1-like [Mytilus galloprovincialis]|uniref:E3 UFM1-protein ligase 1-like n=1 Tax=Mytilus galloprovincialis TaxID=29158 RepID=UPI003F7CB90A